MCFIKSNLLVYAIVGKQNIPGGLLMDKENQKRSKEQEHVGHLSIWKSIVMSSYKIKKGGKLATLKILLRIF